METLRTNEGKHPELSICEHRNERAVHDLFQRSHVSFFPKRHGIIDSHY